MRRLIINITRLTINIIFGHGAPNYLRVKRIGLKHNVALVPKILEVPRLPPRSSLSTGNRGTVPKNVFMNVPGGGGEGGYSTNIWV